MTTLYRQPDTMGLLRVGTKIAKSSECCCQAPCWACHRVWPEEMILAASGWTGAAAPLNGTFVLPMIAEETAFRSRCWYRVFIDPLFVGVYSPSNVNGWAIEMADHLAGGSGYATVWVMTSNTLGGTEPYGVPGLSAYLSASSTNRRCTEFAGVACTFSAGTPSIIEPGVGVVATGPTSITITSG